MANYYDNAPESEWDDWADLEPVDKPERLDVTPVGALHRCRDRRYPVPCGYCWTHIRRCTLAAERTPIDRARIARAVDALSHDLDELRRASVDRALRLLPQFVGSRLA